MTCGFDQTGYFLARFSLLKFNLLKHKKNRWFEKVFSLYNRNLFRRRFADFKIGGIENLGLRDKNLPLVLYANHSSWWDGLLAFEISRRARLNQFVMMEESQLKRLFLFRLLGAFGVVRENPRAAAQSIRYAANLLGEKPFNRALWIFPQGEIVPNDARPLKFYNGAAQIIKQTGKCYAAPVAMRYEFLKDFKPHAFARIGQPQLFDQIAHPKALTLLLANELTGLLDQLKQQITTGATF